MTESLSASLTLFISTLITLIVIMDPPGAVPIFLALTARMTPAERAGLHVGDVVTAIDGTKVTTTAQLQAAIDAKQPGDAVTLTYRRNGTTHTAKVTLANRPS